VVGSLLRIGRTGKHSAVQFLEGFAYCCALCEQAVLGWAPCLGAAAFGVHQYPPLRNAAGAGSAEGIGSNTPPAAGPSPRGRPWPEPLALCAGKTKRPRTGMRGPEHGMALMASLI
jgi:hypothetical protein